MGKNFLIVVLVAALAGCGWLLFQNDVDGFGSTDGQPTKDVMASVLHRMETDLPRVVVGFCWLDDEGEVVSELNGSSPMIPASTFKTLTTIAALDVLGPEFRFTTKVVSEAAIDGWIPGDIMVLGGGDPTLAMSDLEAWADELRAKGVTTIAGGVIGDGRLFPETMAGDFWSWSDVANGYGAPVSGLNLEHNRYQAVFAPGDVEREGVQFIGSRPRVPNVEFLNRVTTGAKGSGDGVTLYGGPLASRILMSGTVPPGGMFGVSGAVPNPPEFAAFHFDRLLRDRGIELGKSPRAVRVDEEFGGETVWIEHPSVRLAEILPGLHARSDNQETECLFLMLGVNAEHPAMSVLTDYWSERGVQSLRVVDGSGLSRADFISAEGLARVQFVAGKMEGAKVYRESLNLSHDGKVRSKVGGMSSVRAWTGYVEGKGSFALMFNHYTDSSKLNAWRDEILDAMVSAELGSER